MTRPIELDGVRKGYGPTCALDGVSIAFEPGSITALLGPNGSGKTTLFRIVLGLTRPDEGTVATPSGTIGCAFQDPQFYGGLTVRENVELFAELTGAAEEWVETLVERCGLARVAHRRAGDVSAGVAKRLDLALALVDRPDALLLDEPLADVDDDHRATLQSLLVDYAADDRILVVATHRFDALGSLVDAVAVMDEGRVVARESTGGEKFIGEAGPNYGDGERRVGGFGGGNGDTGAGLRAFYDGAIDNDAPDTDPPGDDVTGDDATGDGTDR